MSTPLVARPSPIVHFADWYPAAVAADPQPEAATLATVSEEGAPSARLVLIRQWGPSGFEFFTNLSSRKARHIAANPRVALTWHWKPLGRQVRVEGIAERLSDAASDAYWRGRPRGSQLSAITSEQSQPIEGRNWLVDRREREEARLRDVDPLPRPADWGGFLVVPLVVEFWQHEDDRFHQRLEYRRSAATSPWTSRMLQP